jgi:hypothetical protein
MLASAFKPQRVRRHQFGEDDLDGLAGFPKGLQAPSPKDLPFTEKVLFA